MLSRIQSLTALTIVDCSFNDLDLRSSLKKLRIKNCTNNQMLKVNKSNKVIIVNTNFDTLIIGNTCDVHIRDCDFNNLIIKKSVKSLYIENCNITDSILSKIKIRERLTITDCVTLTSKTSDNLAKKYYLKIKISNCLNISDTE